MRSKLVVILALALFLGCCAGFLAPDRANDGFPDQIVLRIAPLEPEPAGASAAAVVVPDARPLLPPAPFVPGPPPTSFRC